MALEVLKGVEKIGGFDVRHADKPSPEFAVSPEFIKVQHEDNIIDFKIQNGPIKENGVNGCQVDTMIEAAVTIIAGLNQKFPSSYNAECLGHLNLALSALRKRKEDRERRGVEGLNKA